MFKELKTCIVQMFIMIKLLFQCANQLTKALENATIHGPIPANFNAWKARRMLKLTTEYLIYKDRAARR